MAKKTTMYGLISYWGADDVRARRDLKIAAVNAIANVCALYPMTASRGNVVPEAGFNAVGTMITALGDLLRDPTSQSVFTTGKGCSSKPPGVLGHFQDQTFYAFIQRRGEVYCADSYVEPAYGWMVQIVDRNESLFPAGSNVRATIAAVDVAEAAWRAQFN